MPRKTPGPQAPNAAKSESTAPAGVAQFEQDMRELEALVETLEQGDLRLEDSLKLFERGTALAKGCKVSLEDAQLKVRSLMEDADSDEVGHIAQS